MKLYLCVDTEDDGLELPIAVADTPAELARILHISQAAVCMGLARRRAGLKSSGYMEIEVDD